MIRIDPLIWAAAGVLTAAVVVFLLRVLWLPGIDTGKDTPKAPGTSAGLPAAARPISTKADVVAFFRQKTGDDPLAAILADAAEAHGRDGCVEVRRGGDGSPYAAELLHRPEEEVAADKRTFAEVRAEVEGLREELMRAANEDERARLRRQIAWLAGGICVLWINLPTEAEYAARRSLVMESVEAFRLACCSGSR
ncbi:MAG: hypothetical protein ACKOTB_14215 [Planctomycetia bacterium]